MVNQLKITFVLILLSLSSNILSKDRVVKFDINKDKRIDRVEIFEGNFLKRVEKDRNNDGKMDSFTIYQKEKHLRSKSLIIIMTVELIEE